MSANLFSRDWYRVAELKPRLRDHITVHAHRYRGKRWYLLEDHITGQVRRLTPQSYLIVGLMNGKRTVDQLWHIASLRLRDEMPTHEELLQLLASLYQANVVRLDTSGDVSELFERGSEATRKRWLAKLKSPLSVQIPVLDPDRFLEATQHWVRPFFSHWALLLWIAAIVAMLFAVGQHWSELTENVSDRILAVDNILMLWLIYPVIKLLHELGHGYCVKRNGGEVHELGIMLLVFIPMPYVDASASAAFADKKQRVLVGMAGIMVELFIAALAMMVWLNAEPGLVKSIAFNTIFIAGVSTVLINGNPLLRFDGYYALADTLEIPNFAQRATQYWGWLTKRVLFGVKGQESPAYDRREALWLFGYGFSALVYRLFLMTTIILFVAQKYFVVGVVLALWALIGTLVWPNLKILFNAWRDSDTSAGSRSPRVMIVLTAALVFMLLVILPVPLSTSIEAVVQMNDERRVLAGENCFVEKLIQSSGSHVSAGDLLLSCKNRRLEVNRQILQHQRAEALAQRQGVWDDPVRIKMYADELRRLDKEIAENRKQLEELQIFSKVAGDWWAAGDIDLPGRYITRGSLLGYIISDRDIKVLGMIPEADIELVRGQVTAVQVLQASALYTPIQPVSWKIFPSASKRLVSPVLADNAGGSVVLNPAESEPSTLQRYFIVDLEFDQMRDVRVDERILVKFMHPPEPLIYRSYRLVRRTFLKYFNV